MRTYRIKMKYYESDFGLERARYGNGTLAIRAHETAGGMEVLSINLEAYGLVPNSDRQFFAKDYSEHEGLPDALVEAGIATKSSEPVRFGYGSAYLMTLRDGVEFMNE